jgi:hypothetical protein
VSLSLLYCFVAPAKHIRKESIGWAELEDDLGTGGEDLRRGGTAAIMHKYSVNLLHVVM